ncbi:penicillin acylase family protein [Singulisphaera sp. PoT]|uniref:penicillin acylase family protein n=1 Tax=Singulisphaera sp. PoT TaxID=3411797 RepID=UPI003BF4977A
MFRRKTRLDGASGTIEIVRTKDGVPQIEAEDLGDVLFGLGYCHGKDRALQMRLVRIVARGRASEILDGSQEMLDLDRFLHRLNFSRDVAQQEAALSGRSKALLDRYNDGVNFAFETLGIPWELRMLGDRARGEPWSFADVYLSGKVIGYMALAVSQAEIERWILECLRSGVGRVQLEELFPGHFEFLDEGLIHQLKLPEAIIPRDLWGQPLLPAAMASNNWVVAGSKTNSGSPFACNDPHLQINRLPAFWYEAVLRWKQDGEPRYAVGATLPGTPGVVIGRNRDLAWTVTYGFMDCVDSWVEDCRDGKYRRGEEWLPFRIRKETVARKRQEPVELTFYENEHGTLEGDPNEPGYYLASRWSCGEETGASSLEGLLGILTTGTVEEGRAVLGKLCNSSWNWLLADRAGSIGYQMAGKMPLRRDGWTGLIPLKGWEPENDWRGFADLEDLPRAMNPREGFFATANDDLNDLGRVRPINACVAPYRAERIRDVLAGSERLSVEDMKNLQYDTRSIQAGRFLAILEPLLRERRESPNAQLLLDWDGDYRQDSRACWLFEAFYRELILEVFGGKHGYDASGPRRIGTPVIDYLMDQTTLFAEFYGAFDRVLLAESSLWFGSRGRAEVYAAALDRVLDRKPKRFGATRKFSLDHILLGGKFPRLLGFDRGPIPLRGGRATVHQGQIFRNRERDLVSGPSYRFVTDLATDELCANLPGGASDRRFSRWYANGIKDWLKGRYHRLRGPKS